jgi:thiol-disulfide isomerase/thioredoxin
MNKRRRQLAIVPASAFLSAGLAGIQALAGPVQALGTEGSMPSLAGATEWINSAPQTPESLRGKVVLVAFWTYTCINSLRPMPYVRAWAEKYKAAGLVVIGAHSPEFSFEKKSANVHRAINDLAIGFPVAVDSNFGVWRAFANQYWPAFYFIDAKGRIRHHRFGEEQYARSEQVIQQLLAEAGKPDVPSGLVAPTGSGTQAAPGTPPAQTGETYLGYQQAANFASPERVARDRAHDCQFPDVVRTDQWALAGRWAVDQERATLNAAGGRIAFRFRARDLHLVLGSTPENARVRFKVSVDGEAPQSDAGTDVDAQGHGVIDAPRLYQLVRQTGNRRERLFEIEFIDSGAQAYVFTFG